MVEKVYILDAGSLNMDKSILTSGRNFGEKRIATIHMVLLKDDEYGWILVDTGLNPIGVTEPEKAWGARAKVVKPIIAENNDIRFHLKQLGLTTGDIKHVINTHLHWDHTGGNRYFQHATFYVQKSEYRFAFYPDKFLQGSYMNDHFDCGVKYELLEGDVELFPGIFLIQTPGHTPGSQSVMVKTKSGKHIIIAGDALYTQENLDEVIPPGNCWNQEAAISSINKIKLIQKLTGALVLPGHDPNLWDVVPKSPEFIS